MERIRYLAQRISPEEGTQGTESDWTETQQGNSNYMWPRLSPSVRLDLVWDGGGQERSGVCSIDLFCRLVLRAVTVFGVLWFHVDKASAVEHHNIIVVEDPLAFYLTFS